MLRDSDRVRGVNQRFYAALSKQNLLDMEQIWAHGSHVRCIHAGGALLEGWESIRESWRSIFQGALCLTVEPENEQVTLLGAAAAVVSCCERVTSFTLEGSTVTRVQATNVFEKKDGTWRLVHHHASLVPVRGGTAEA